MTKENLFKEDKDLQVLVQLRCECGEIVTASFFDESNVPAEDLDDSGYDLVDCDCGRVWHVEKPVIAIELHRADQ